MELVKVQNPLDQLNSELVFFSDDIFIGLSPYLRFEKLVFQF
jgi:hypothetical protein